MLKNYVDAFMFIIGLAILVFGLWMIEPYSLLVVAGATAMWVDLPVPTKEDKQNVDP